MYWSLDDCFSPKKNEYNLLSTEPELKHAPGHETEQLDYWSLITDYWSLFTGHLKLATCHLSPFDYAQGDAFNLQPSTYNPAVVFHTAGQAFNPSAKLSALLATLRLRSGRSL